MWALVAPEVDDLTRPFWAACDRGELSLQRCDRCRLFIHHPEVLCPHCGSDSTSYEPVSGDGRIETFTWIHRSFVPAYRDSPPFAVGWIALPEQRNLRIFGRITGEPDSLIEIGAPVRVAFDRLPDFGNLPYWVVGESV